MRIWIGESGSCRQLTEAGAGRKRGISGRGRGIFRGGRGRNGRGSADDRKRTAGRIAGGKEGFWEWVGWDGAWGRSCMEPEGRFS